MNVHGRFAPGRALLRRSSCVENLACPIWLAFHHYWPKGTQVKASGVIRSVRGLGQQGKARDTYCDDSIGYSSSIIQRGHPVFGDEFRLQMPHKSVIDISRVERGTHQILLLLTWMHVCRPPHVLIRLNIPRIRIGGLWVCVNIEVDRVGESREELGGHPLVIN